MNIKDQIKRYKAGELNSREGLELLDMLLAQKTGMELKHRVDAEVERRALVRLSRDYTQIDISPEKQGAAIRDAYWVTASPHEWVWTTDQQANMARYVLWASQRIEAMKHIANGKPLLHEANISDQPRPTNGE